MNTISIKQSFIEPLNKYSDLFSPVEFIDLELNDQSFIGSVQKIVVLEERIFILDGIKKALHIFDRSGKHIHTYEKLGAGPGELLDLIDFTYDDVEGKLYLLDISKILTLDYVGNFLEEIKLDIGGLGFQYSEKHGRFYFIVGRGHPYVVGVVNKRGKLIAEHFEKNNLNSISNSKNLTKSGENIYLKLYLNDTIYKLERNDSEVLKYFDFDRKLTSEIYWEINDNFSIDKVADIIPTIMSNINFYTEIENKSFVIFHFDRKKHYIVFDSKLNKYRVFDETESINDLTYEPKYSFIEGITPKGLLINVLDAEILSEETLNVFNPDYQKGISLKNLVIGKSFEYSNPVIMLSKINI